MADMTAEKENLAPGKRKFESEDTDDWLQSPPKQLKLLQSAPRKANMTFTVMGFSAFGTKPYNEDRLCFQTFNFKDSLYTMAGVFDGHGGDEAAEFTSRNLFDRIALNIRCGMSSIPEAISAAFISIHQEMLKHELKKWKKVGHGIPSTSGTTASILVFHGSTCYYGWVGDSPIIVGMREDPGFDLWKGVRLTKDHSTDDPDEVAGIVSRGGQIVDNRVVWHKPVLKDGAWARKPVGFLNMTRALGDFWSQHATSKDFVVSPIPTVAQFQIDPSVKCLALCSDGVTDILTDQDIITCFQAQDNYETLANRGWQSKAWINVAEEIINLASRRAKNEIYVDNLTVLTIRLNFKDSITGEEI